MKLLKIRAAPPIRFITLCLVSLTQVHFQSFLCRFCIFKIPVKSSPRCNFALRFASAKSIVNYAPRPPSLRSDIWGFQASTEDDWHWKSPPNLDSHSIRDRNGWIGNSLQNRTCISQPKYAIFDQKIHFSRRVSLKTAALFSFLSSRQSQQFSVSKITGISRAFFLFVCFPKEQVESCLLMKLVVLWSINLLNDWPAGIIIPWLDWSLLQTYTRFLNQN